MTVLYDSIKRLYDAGKLTAEGVHNAVTRGWITEEEYQTIITQPVVNAQTDR